MVYKGHREITTIDVPYFLLYAFGSFLLDVPYKGVPYKTENIIQQCLVNDLPDEGCFGA